MPANKYNTATDEQLLQLYRAKGDTEALGTALQRYTFLLLGVAIKYLRDKNLAEDAVQQVFVKAIAHLSKEEIHNFKGWLYILMRNYCLQLLRDKQYFNEVTELINIEQTETRKEDAQWKEQTLDQISSTLEELDEPQRKCITLFYLKKLSYKQITEQTGYSYEQVKSYIQNGKRNLKLILTRNEYKHK